MSYAQARLRLGILGVGLWTVLSALALFLGWTRILQLHEWFTIFVLVSLPLDLLGGQILPHLWGKPRRGLARWTLSYLRAVPLQLGVMATGLLSIQAVADRAGTCWAALLYGVLALYQLEKQEWLSRLMGLPIHPVAEPAAPYAMAEAEDPRFSGGISGLPGCERVVVPAHWWHSFSSDWLLQHVQRRHYLIRSGARNAGLMLAVFFNAGVLLLVLPWCLGDPVALSCWFTLGSFVGLLVLPSLSRSGVESADAFMAQLRPPEEVAGWLSQLELLQEEDSRRSLWVERIFHPIPQIGHRLAALGRPLRVRPWNAARYALLTSWLAGGLLARAVHCNSGRPELWLWPPGD